MNSSIPLPPPGRTRRIVGALVAAMALVALADPAVAAGSEEKTAGTIEMTLADGGVATGGSVNAGFTVSGDDDEITVTRGDALRSADEVRAWLRGSGSASTAVDEVAVADGDDEITAALSFAGVAGGVYPLAAAWDGAEQRAVVYVPGSDQQGLAVVAPITAPAIEAGILSADALAELTAADGSLTAQLEAVDGTAAILAVDPAIPAAIRALGDNAPASATAWLERLLALPNDRFALQYGDADVTPQIDAGLDAPLAPSHLGNFLDASAADATLSSLLDIGDDAGHLYWPSPGSADDDTVAALTDGTDARVLAPASSTTDDEPSLGADVLAYDDELASALLAAGREEDPDRRALETEAVRAQLWLAELDADAPLLIAFDRAETDGLADALEAATSLGSGKLVGLGGVLDAAGGSVSLRDAEPDEDRVAALAGYAEDQPGLTTISTALAEPAAFLGATRAEMQQLLSVAWQGDDEGWDARAEALAILNDDRAHAIELQQQQPVQLLSGSALMPVWIRNDLPYPAEVTIIAVSDDPRLVIEQRTVVTAQADSVTRAKIDVKARVGSGDVTVHYTLESAPGTQIGPTRDAPVTVRASWERVGLGVLGTIIVLFLGIGGVRQVRRRRRDRADAQPVR
jgi:hypothetical protein